MFRQAEAQYCVNCIYGLSQIPEAKDYIMVLKCQYYKGCGKKYTNIISKFCGPCHIKNTNVMNGKNEKAND